MSYIGNIPVTGDNNSFKLLDNVTSHTLTFDGSSTSVVSTANNTIFSTDHRFLTGQRVTYNDGGGTAITGLSDGVYYIIKHSQNTIQLAANASDAALGTSINLTGVGAGTAHTLNVAFDGVNTNFRATFDSGIKAGITRAAQLQISINGVIQQPQDTATPTTGFGIDVDSIIAFSAAPVSTDVFWGSLVAKNFPTFDIADNDTDVFTGDNSAVSFTLSKDPKNARNILVTLDGVVQYPSSPGVVRAYDVSQNVLSFSSAPGLGVDISVRHIGFAGPSINAIDNTIGITSAGTTIDTDAQTLNFTGPEFNVTSSGTTVDIGLTGTFAGLVGIGTDNPSALLTVGADKGFQVPATGSIIAERNFAIKTVYPLLKFIDTDSNSDFQIQNANGTFGIRDITNSADRFVIQSDGKIGISTDMSVGGTINVGSGTSISSPGTNILSVGTGISELRLDGSGFSIRKSSEQFNSFIRTGATSSGDYIGNLSYKANDSAENETEYVKLLSQIVDNTNGSEDSRYQIETLRGGTLTQSAKAESGYFLTPSNPGVYLDALDWTSSNNYMHDGNQFWQVGSNWNNSTGTFTCPVAGKYFLAADAQGHNTHAQTGASNQYANLVPRVNNSNVGQESVVTTKENGTSSGGTDTHTSFGFSIILNCNANDTIRVHSNHGFRSNTQNHLTIYLIG